jgi:predicted membrane channel-forming protein YqfA (hemolysin III family)
MRTVLLAVTIVFLAGFLGITVYAVADEGFSILSAVSFLVLALMGIGILGAIWEEPPDDG